MLRQSSLRPDLPHLLRGPRAGRTSRRLMLTTTAPPAFYAEHGIIGGALKSPPTRRGADAGAADGDDRPRDIPRLDEDLGGIAPGRHATLMVLPEIGEWRPEARFVARARSSRRKLIVPHARPALAQAPACSDPTRAVRSPDRLQPVARYQLAVINRRRTARSRRTRPRPRWSPATGPGSRRAALRTSSPTRRPSRPPRRPHCDAAGSGSRSRRDGAAPHHATSCAEMGGGFAFDNGWRRAAGDRRTDRRRWLRPSRCASSNSSPRPMREAGYPFHDPLYSLLFTSALPARGSGSRPAGCSK